MLGTVNRVLIALAGLLLLALGGSVLAVGLGAPSPSWWIHQGRHDVLLSTAERTHWRDAGWWWPTVLAALAVLVLLALWWLTAQLRRRRLTEVRVDTGDGESALLRGRALETVLATDAAHQQGVSHAQAVLRGTRTAPQVRVWLQLEPDVAPGEALDDLTAQALTHARDSAALEKLPAEVRLTSVKHRAERVT
ncbi:alkaline shock response membrane anchor protein AmaP [Streptomyces hyaluromycini]|uniref:alkaline shock response membrane anchor protein AmaP n=1 Tax=Streptomyces hyaluromycini TaxID=1377993 RepID=UPI000B5CEF9D|nr:alkaline shock response membrane anchor protein AmaP [Streptomyces hyaluromycini]